MFTGRFSVARQQSVNVIAMFCDLRNFTNYTSALPPDGVARVAAAVYNRIVQHCAASIFGEPVPKLFKPAGDGLLVVWEDNDRSPTVAEAVVKHVLSMYRDFSLPKDLGVEIPPYLGIGLVRDAATAVTWQAEDARETPDYFGFAINLAAKLQTLARPAGVILPKAHFVSALSSELLDQFTLSSAYIADAYRALLVHPMQIADAGTAVRASSVTAALRPSAMAELFPASRGYVCAVEEAALVATGVKRANAALITDPASVAKVMSVLGDPIHQRLVPRGIVETDPVYRQVVPCAIIRCDQAVLSYLRGAKGPEKRLGGERSLFVGGHLRAVPNDLLFQESFRSVPSTELHSIFQKVALRAGAYSWKRLGILWGNGTPINAVHIGIVHLYDVTAQSDVEVIDQEELPEAAWRPLTAFPSTDYDSWSAICLSLLNPQP